jgi:hypothetical protein
MNNWVVGQEVSIESGVYGCKGKVVKVTSDSVEVLVEAAPDDQMQRMLSRCSPEERAERIAMNKAELLRFDNEGNELDDSRRARLGFGPSPEDKFHTVLWNTAPECQPWHLVPVPRTESN